MLIKQIVSVITCIAILALADVSHAQEANRLSLAGVEAFEAQKAASSAEQQRYNFRVGQLRLRLDANASTEYNDNISISKSNAKEDVILGTMVNIEAFYPLTTQNSLNLKIGMGYNKHIDYPEADSKSMLITPDSELAFEFFVGDFRINVHDRFSYQQDPVDVAGVSNVTNFGRYDNTAGLGVLWDLNDMIVGAGFDHNSFWANQSEFEYLDRDTEIFYLNTNFIINPTLTAGLETVTSVTTYDQEVLNDNISFQVGPVVDVQLSKYISLAASTGYQMLSFDEGGSSGNTGDLDSYYASLTMGHRFNKYMNQTLSGGHANTLGINSDYSEMNYLRYRLDWALINNVTSTFDAFWENMEDSSSASAEDADRYGIGVGLQYQLTQSILTGVSYRYTEKISNDSERDYNQNRVAMNFRYLF